MDLVTQYLVNYELQMQEMYPSEQQMIRMELERKLALQKQAQQARREYTATQQEANRGIYAYNAKRREVSDSHASRLATLQSSGKRLVSRAEAAHSIHRNAGRKP